MIGGVVVVEGATTAPAGKPASLGRSGPATVTGATRII
jgi:hypothetical protein